ncbi:MAG TPA: HPr family phosphocarrier protein [Firmicutes bacterium]|nr:HPr family phosphocarrier protein [Bacillota bacterium]
MKAEITLNAPCDLYGRNAHILQQATSSLQGSIYMQGVKSKRACRLSSLIGILSMGIQSGEPIQITAYGPDSDQNLNQIVHVLSHMQ